MTGKTAEKAAGKTTKTPAKPSAKKPTAKVTKKASGADFDLKNINYLENANIKSVKTYLDDGLKDFTKAPLKKVTE